MEDITDEDYTYAKRVCKNFEIKSDTFLLADVSENFQNMYIEIYELDPARFLTAPALAWQAVLNETNVKLDLLTDIDMLLMVEKGIRGEICHAIH